MDKIMVEYLKLERKLLTYANKHNIALLDLAENILLYSDADRYDIADILSQQIELIKEMVKIETDAVVSADVVSLDDYRKLRK